MSINEVLELDYLVEDITDDSFNITNEPSNASSSIDYVRKQFGVFDPPEVGTYNIDINGQTIEIDVYDIPDSGDLHLHLDASDKLSVDPWESEVGTNLSTVGTPTLLTSEKNGNNVVRYDGTDDGHVGSFASSQTQPNHLFMTFRQRDPASQSKREYILGTNDSGNRQDFANEADGSAWVQHGGTAQTGGSPNTNWHILNAYFDGANSYVKIDGTQVLSGDIGAGGYSSISIGYLQWNNDNWATVDVGELLVYPQDKQAIEADVESYLSNKWAITI